jgi:hypothetical protein
MLHFLEKKSFAIVLIISIGAMLTIFSFLVSADLKIPQREVSLQIKIKNQVNICLPEEKFDDENL